MMRKSIYAPIIMFALTQLLACGVSYDLGSHPPSETDINTTNPTWEADIQFLIQVKCMNCHAEPKPQRAPKLTPPIAFDSLQIFKVDYLDRIKERVFNSPNNPMPPNFGTALTQPEKDAIKLFINQTELAQKPATPTPTPTPNGPTGPTLSQYFQTKCANCHGQYGQKIDISKKAILKTKLTLDDFVYKVRQGGGGMPAFNTVEFPGTTLSADYSLLFNF